MWHLFFRPLYDSKFSLTLNGKRFVILTVLFRNFCSCTRPKLFPYMSLLWKAYHQGSLPNQRVSWVQSQISVICEWPHTAGTNIWIVFSVQGEAVLEKEVKVFKMFSLFLHLLVLRGLMAERGYTSYDIWFQASLWLKVLTRLKREADCYSECVF